MSSLSLSYTQTLVPVVPLSFASSSTLGLLWLCSRHYSRSTTPHQPEDMSALPKQLSGFPRTSTGLVFPVMLRSSLPRVLIVSARNIKQRNSQGCCVPCQCLTAHGRTSPLISSPDFPLTTTTIFIPSLKVPTEFYYISLPDPRAAPYKHHWK